MELPDAKKPRLAGRLGEKNPLGAGLGREERAIT